jgi:hypothetical protein
MKTRVGALAALVAGVALACAATAAADPKPQLVAHGQMLTQIAQIFPEVDPRESFDAVAMLTGADGSAKGHIRADFFDWWAVGWKEVRADVDCMLVDGDRAVVWGHVTNATPENDPTLFWWFQYLAIVLQPDPEGVLHGAVVAAQYSIPPETCATVGMENFWSFAGNEVIGNVHLRP